MPPEGDRRPVPDSQRVFCPLCRRDVPGISFDDHLLKIHRLSTYRGVRRSFEETLEAIRQGIQDAYSSRGRYGATVEIEVEELPRNRVAIDLTINEGEESRIRQINIVGNEAFSDEELLELFELGATWPGQSTPAVAGVSLRLAPGDRLHLAGPSGAGKTTLAQTLVRFLDYTGSYRIGGVEARELAQSEVRRVVGLCEQHPWLFDESIRQNLFFAKDTATDAELWAVIDRVGLGEWTRRRGGLDARVGERGALVSGGQAQRIALARALLADFPILIVDEPTANVDAEQGDRLVRDILNAATSERRAVLLISHTPVPDELITARVTLPFIL